MASQVFTGVGDFSKTNNTGQNVRVFISYMEEKFASSISPQDVLQLSWGKVTTAISDINDIRPTDLIIRGPISATDFSVIPAKELTSGRTINFIYGLPYQIMLKPLETFSAKNCGAYNLAFIPEDVPNGSLPSQVLSDSSSLSYTNNTGRNVRLVINYMHLPGVKANQVTLGGTVLSLEDASILFSGVQYITKNKLQPSDLSTGPLYYPRAFTSPELFLAPGQSFTANCLAYNVVAIPE